MSADSVLMTFATGVRALGMFIMHADQSEITADTWHEIGDLLTTLAEAQMALRDLQVAAEQGEPTG